jgi:hypothetical protein
MKHIRSFNNFKGYKQDLEKYSVLLENVELSPNDNQLFMNIFNSFLEKYNTEESIKNEIRNYISSINYDSLNESFWDKLKERFPKAAQVSKMLSDKAEAVLGKIINGVKDAVSFVKKMGQSIKEFFISAIQKGKEIFTEQIVNGKLKGKIEELVNTKKDGLIKDLKTSKDVINFYRKEFIGKILGSTEKNMTNILVSESLITEGENNVIATLVHKIESIPPFSWLHSVAKAGEAGASAVIKSISNVTQKLGGPAFELPVIALLLGIVFEQMVKGQVGHWLIDLAGSATPLGLAIKGVKTVAFFVALIVALDATIGQKLLGSHGHGDEHGKEDHKEEEKDLEKSDDKNSEV